MCRIRGKKRKVQAGAVVAEEVAGARHSVTVSAKHYGQVPGNEYGLAAGIEKAYQRAHHPNLPGGTGALFSSGPARIRTEDQAIMSRLL